MKVLFVSAANRRKGINQIVKNQGDALEKAGVVVDYFPIVGRGWLGYAKNILPLRKHIRANHYDAIHAHYSLTAFVASLAGCQNLIVSLMGSDLKSSKYHKKIIKGVAKLFQWKQIIVKSQDMYEALNDNKAVIIPNGVDADRFHPMDKLQCRDYLGWSDQKIHVLFPARPTRPEKNFALAQCAIEHLQAEYDNKIELHVFGDIPNDQTPYHYNASDVVLLTSKWEGSPNALKEALACDRPIVSTNVGDVEQMLTGLDGCFIVDDDECQVEEKLRLIFTTPTYQNSTNRVSRARTMYGNEYVVKQLVNIYSR